MEVNLEKQPKIMHTGDQIMELDLEFKMTTDCKVTKLVCWGPVYIYLKITSRYTVALGRMVCLCA